MNGFQLPQRAVERLNYLSGYFDNAITALVENSIEANLSKLPQQDIIKLNESVNKTFGSKLSPITESDLGHDHNEATQTIKKTDSILRNLLIKKGVRVAILESEAPDTKDSSRQPIMGDDEDPQSGVDVDNKKEIPKDDTTGTSGGNEDTSGGSMGDIGDDSLDEDTGESGFPQQNAEQPIASQDGDQPQSNPEDIQQQLTPDQNLQLELAQTDNKFVTLVLYDKIVQLIGSIDVIKDNISSNQTEDEMDFIDSIEKYKTYLEILNELIFVMDINTIYYNVATIHIEVNDLMDKYLERTKIKKIQSKDSTNQDKQDAIEDLDEIDELDKEIDAEA